MNILFITSSRIGDAVLSSGLLNHIDQTYPNAKVTIACGPLAVSLFEGYPKLERIIPMKKASYAGHWRKLWLEVVGTKWDLVVDLRNSVVSRLIRAQRRYMFGPHIDKRLHKVEQNAAVMALDDVPAPKLWFTDGQLEKAKALIPRNNMLSQRKPGSRGFEQPDPGLRRDDDLVLGVGPTANWIGKTWPEERFIEIVQFLTGPGGFMDGARVAVFAAPGEEEPALKVLHSIPEERRIDVIAKTSPGEAAATLARCDFYIGNDSGLMHCAAAGGVPTLGLFGASYPHLYAPWGEHAHYVRTPETFDELTDYEGYSPETCGCLMESLTVDAVKAKLGEVFSEHSVIPAQAGTG